MTPRDLLGINWLVPPILPYIWYGTRLIGTRLQSYPCMLNIRQSRGTAARSSSPPSRTGSSTRSPSSSRADVVGPASDSFQILDVPPAMSNLLHSRRSTLRDRALALLLLRLLDRCRELNRQLALGNVSTGRHGQSTLPGRVRRSRSLTALINRDALRRRSRESPSTGIAPPLRRIRWFWMLRGTSHHSRAGRSLRWANRRRTRSLATPHSRHRGRAGEAD